MLRVPPLRLRLRHAESVEAASLLQLLYFHNDDVSVEPNPPHPPPAHGAFSSASSSCSSSPTRGIVHFPPSGLLQRSAYTSVSISSTMASLDAGSSRKFGQSSGALETRPRLHLLRQNILE